MAKEKAVSFLLYVGAVPTAMGSETNTTLSFAHTPIDVTDKGSSEWEENLSGLKSWTLENTGFYITSDTAYGEIEAAALAGNSLAIKLRDTNNNDQWTGTCYITALSLTAANPEAVQQAISFKGTGALVPSTY